MTKDSETEEKPCLVKAQQGFSVLYKKKFLYSKYQPQAAILRYIASLNILPHTLLLCYAPLLGYGLKELIQKIPESCHIIVVDFDTELHSFFLETNKDLIIQEKIITPVILKKAEEIVKLLQMGTLIPHPESFRRTLVVKMSGGTVFHEDQFKAVTAFTDEFIRNNWKNIITLTRMGRLYALDIFKNLNIIKKSNNIKYLKKNSIARAILVIGAGISTDELLQSLRQNKDNFFIICVDAALPSLLSKGIKPDSVIAVECQLAIEKAYIGSQGSGINIIADLTSRPHVTQICGGSISFFLSEYCRLPFMKDLEESLKDTGIPIFPALGSVGLYAVEIALYLRKEGIPVFICGLDFSFIPGQTHCKGAPAHTTSILTANRLRPAGSPASAYTFSAKKISDKKEKAVYTDAALSGYGALYVDRYKGIKDLYDCGQTGIKNSLPRISIREMIEFSSKFGNDSAYTDAFSGPAFNSAENSYISNQKEKITRLRKILTGREKEKYDKESERIISDCSYLYAHFPDSVSGVRDTPDFLNRIRAEIDIFLKALDFQL
ncbi:MAG: DUF115 domain-containing protein [Treponemataceae bacterium]|nr:DUF115 domain-containing protein [Treponemataceae bacterium]